MKEDMNDIFIFVAQDKHYTVTVPCKSYEDACKVAKTYLIECGISDSSLDIKEEGTIEDAMERFLRSSWASMV